MNGKRVINLIIDEEFYSRITACAKRSERSMVGWVRHALWDAVLLDESGAHDGSVAAAITALADTLRVQKIKKLATDCGGKVVEDGFPK